MFFSCIIPVYNRAGEIKDLLNSLLSQSYTQFEVVIVEDGSTLRCEEVVAAFGHDLSIRYFYQENTGQGFARNFGMQQAKGDFFVILDSDVLLPPTYFEALEKAIATRSLDAFGGPDAAAEDFSPLQKAMDFAMTSFWTTGGIRGKLKDTAAYQARGFNMGVSRAVFDRLGGFVDPNRGEDIEWSLRIKKAGFRLELVSQAFVYHKRKNTLWSFAKQGFSFGRNRVNVSRYHPEAIKLVHALPSFFLLFLISLGINLLFIQLLLLPHLLILGLWAGLVLAQSSWEHRSLIVGILSLGTSLVQLSGYGLGLLLELLIKWSKG
ncbi:MAG: glycosyltransferase [Algoriphagus sp.]|jgi:glycosyltransferase involved in cell wall biosynthesis|uniref:glycosyltransferase n=1 Tax=Algoriphagus sp. TaxID=1872435 RepID=UPI00277AC293|nr:glycosyltransferase [Algoriphagus sp.]MDP4748093.1 glycosyltransferase [Algoriphagus sp.]MDP4839150.1 glycosyltransferase [Algoriphagus sp.]MDP4904333.1 glycosyltransferase [Algoriphagus sp.]MDP4956830.1 glycosyltransferase [Algoriphagus sp.]